MEKVSAWLDHLINGIVWRSVFSQFQAVDWVAFVFLAVGVLFGLRKGLMRELALNLETAVLIYIVFEYDKIIASILRMYFPKFPPDIAAPVAYFFTGVVIFLLIHFADGVMHSWLHTQLVAPLKVVGGAILGGIRSVLIFSFLSQFLILIPFPAIQEIYKAGNSYLTHPIVQWAPKVHDFLGKFAGVFPVH